LLHAHAISHTYDLSSSCLPYFRGYLIPSLSFSSIEKLQGSATFTRSRRRLFVGALVVYRYRITWLTVHSQGDKGVFLEKKVKPLFVRPLPSVLLRHCHRLSSSTSQKFWVWFRKKLAGAAPVAVNIPFLRGQDTPSSSICINALTISFLHTSQHQISVGRNVCCITIP
jgi:hypothetical protein